MHHPEQTRPLWSCSKVSRIWEWITFLGPLTLQDLSQAFCPSVGQALVGKPLDDASAIPVKWWQLICLMALWFIWIVRNSESIPPTKAVPAIVTRARVWSQIRMSLKVVWERKCRLANGDA